MTGKEFVESYRTGRRSFEEADLSGANLSDADLSGANLSRANLSRANLSDANLSGANLSGVDLSRADLSDAYLSGANLSRADLSDANLSGAYLSGVDLRCANLSRAILIGADIDFSVWPLHCGGLRVKIDRRIAAQLAYHFCAQECDDPDYLKARTGLIEFANTFHRIDECGVLRELDNHAESTPENEDDNDES